MNGWSYFVIRFSPVPEEDPYDNIALCVFKPHKNRIYYYEDFPRLTSHFDEEFLSDYLLRLEFVIENLSFENLVSCIQRSSQFKVTKPRELVYPPNNYMTDEFVKILMNRYLKPSRNGFYRIKEKAS